MKDEKLMPEKRDNPFTSATAWPIIVMSAEARRDVRRILDRAARRLAHEERMLRSERAGTSPEMDSSVSM